MKNIYIFFLLCTTLVMQAQQTKEKTPAAEIEKVMAMQENAWNEGNVDRFMEGYWNSDSLCFVGSSGLTYGWKQTLANYKKNYPNRATMGKLTFTILKEELLGKNSYLVLGKWHLERQDAVGGYFSLIWKKIGGKWVITCDHTS